ncbi:MAG TPA: efflux RND transporter periplasmic adaptor subunit [Hyphomonas sp.]|nr:efflux RND transporter periplasmic adaptor subunit [Hyphomonas sp.]MCB9963157.1 efflux RND transporter periplasmic adaptor subunit [Hyphomonas sp.]MCB9970093.1 efflux RND transporter periplasmic adaptor subunit [Hyphomonas sp.]HPE47639.1 efflux RND transporter periplasmic adaptor subunit [Hyphomonas sp.]
MNRSTFIAVAIVVALIAWFGFNSLKRGSLSSHEAASQEQAADETPEAVIETLVAEPHMLQIDAKGRTAPDKSVTVKAGTSGNVVSTPAKEGNFVKAGTLLCGLDVEARAARVKEAEAARDSARVDYEAAASLAAKGLGAANLATGAKAKLDAAGAALDAAKVELSKTQIRAPFDGIFETRIAEAGDFLAPGQACGVLVDMDPVIVSVQLSEAQAGRLTTGLDGHTRLANGKTYPVKLRYVARTADGPTRTFLVEAAIQSGEDEVPAGITAELFVPIGQVPATMISAGLLTLSDQGQLGVRYVEADNTVQFAPVTVIDQTPEGTWVTGLPATAKVISLGQDYLADGVTVKPVASHGAQP